jgi:hypothetical protein
MTGIESLIEKLLEIEKKTNDEWMSSLNNRKRR